MQEIIYLEAEDSIATVRARLSRVESGAAAIVVPAGVRLFQNLVNLKLLQRIAADYGVNVTLVTRDHTTCSLAREIRVPVRSSVRTGKPAEAAAAAASGAAAGATLAQPEPGSLRPQGTIVQRSVPVRPGGVFPPASGAPSGRTGRLARIRPSANTSAGQRVFGYALLLVFLAAVGLGALLLAPDATVDLTPASETITRTIAVKAASDVRSVDVSRGQIPARLVQVTMLDSAQADSTDRRQAPAHKATGRVVITNRSGSAVTVPQGTVVRTGTGAVLRFLTSAPATVDANSSTQVPIVAELPGSTGNLPAGSISQLEGSLSFQLSVINDTPTSGGTEQQAALVAAADRVRLRDTLYARMKAAAEQTVRDELKAGEMLLRSEIALRVEDESFDREVGEISKSVGLRMRMSASALAIPADGLKKLAQAALESGLPSGAELVPSSLVLGEPYEVQVEGSTATFRFDANGVSMVGLDVQQVRGDIVGLTVQQAEQTLLRRYRLNRDPDITLQNGWLGRLPILGFRIHVNLLRS